MSSALKVREDIDRFGHDSRVSNFQLLLKEIARDAKEGLELVRRMGAKGHSVVELPNSASQCKSTSFLL